MQLPSKVSASRVAAEPVMAAKKSVGKKTSTEGKGGILPWVTNEPGSKCQASNPAAASGLGSPPNCQCSRLLMLT